VRYETDTELERALTSIADRLDVTPSRDLATVVVRRIARSDRQVRLTSPGARRVFILVALMLTVFAGAAVAGALGVPGLRIIFRDQPAPTVAPVPSNQPTELDIAGLALGVEVDDVGSVSDRLDFAPLLPTDPRVGDPRVFVSMTPAGGRTSLLYLPNDFLPESRATGVGALLAQFQGDLAPSFVTKLADQGVLVEPVQIGGYDGWWIEGLHEVRFEDRNGSVQSLTNRVSDNVLVWRVGAMTLRLESALARDAAIDLALTVR